MPRSSRRAPDAKVGSVVSGWGVCEVTKIVKYTELMVNHLIEAVFDWPVQITTFQTTRFG
jgi:hypothetical protein